MLVKNEAENNTHCKVEIDVTNDLKHLSDPRIKRIKEILRKVAHGQYNFQLSVPREKLWNYNKKSTEAARFLDKSNTKMNF